jgi:hypothetical protein
MSIFDKLLGIKLDEDFTETSWWADAVFRGLASQGLSEQDPDLETTESAGSQPAGLT